MLGAERDLSRCGGVSWEFSRHFIPGYLREAGMEEEIDEELYGVAMGSSWKEAHRCELDCANSSDALLMNVFCYPGMLLRAELCGLLGVDVGCVPEFGVKPRVPLGRTPLSKGRGDATEVDMKLGDLLVEAKLTESGFQVAPERLVTRYRDLEEVFDVALLPRVEKGFAGIS